MRNVELHEGVGIEPLRQLEHLKELCLSSLSSFEEHNLSLLSSVGEKTLKKLSLAHCRLLENELHHLTRLEWLADLSLIMVTLCEDDIHSLALLTNLKSLHIFGQINGPADLSLLRHLTKLKHLSLQVSNGVDPDIAGHLGELEQLKTLVLRLRFNGDEEGGADQARMIACVGDNASKCVTRCRRGCAGACDTRVAQNVRRRCKELET